MTASGLRDMPDASRKQTALKKRLRRLGEFDIADSLAPTVPPIIVQIAFGVLCTAASIFARMMLDVVAPAAGPYSLIYPAILISTLYGRWVAGLITLISSFLFAWYFVLPAQNSFEFLDPNDGPRSLINGAAAFVCFGFAEIFRRAVRRAQAERDMEIEARDMLIREIDHRVKNNFTIVASLLDMQGRRQKTKAAQDALATAVSRVHSFAAAHQALYKRDTDLNEVGMADYLEALTSNLSRGLFLPKKVRLVSRLEDAAMERDEAIAVGLVLNEIVTNAAKHAFGPEDTGEILVEFENGDAGWKLTVSDNGRGMPQGKTSSGLGSSLIAAFAEKANGVIAVEPLQPGTRVTLVQASED